MTCDDALIWLWLVIFFAPSILAFASGRRRLRWWLLANLIGGVQPSAWIVMLMLAGRRSWR